jgi:hypothetical protein
VRAAREAEGPLPFRLGVGARPIAAEEVAA